MPCNNFVCHWRKNYTLFRRNRMKKKPLTILEVIISLTFPDSIDQLSTFFRHVKPKVNSSDSHPCIEILDQMWSIIQAIFEKQSHILRISESLCRLFRNAFENYEMSMMLLLSRLLPLLLNAYKFTKYPCFIWVSSHAIRVFGAHPQCKSLVISLVSELVNIAHSEIQQGRFDEEMVEEYVYFLIAVNKASQQLMEPNKFLQTFMCATHLLSNTTPIILTSIVEYFTQIVNDKQLNSVLVQNGQPVVTGLMNAMVSLFSRDRHVVEDVGQLLLYFAPLLGTSIITYAHQVVLTLKIPDEPQKVFLNSFTA